jgi:hypothetical protein
VALGTPLAVLVAALLLVTWGPAGGAKVAADAPHAGLDFSIGVDTNGDTTNDCSTGGGSATCDFGTVGTRFQVRVYLNSLPNGIANYGGFDIFLENQGVAGKVEGGAAVADANQWPQCSFEAVAPADPARVAWGCATFTQQSTYTGLIGTADFNCTASGSLAIVHHDGVDGLAATALTEVPGSVHAEGRGTRETLTINCGGAAQPTPTPGTPASPTPTPTLGTPASPTATRPPTNTPTRRPPTPTRTPAPPVSLGDVDGNGRIDSLDALRVLWDEANSPGAERVPLPENADMNDDGRINSIDALLIKQIAAGLA